MGAIVLYFKPLHVPGGHCLYFPLHPCRHCILLHFAAAASMVVLPRFSSFLGDNVPSPCEGSQVWPPNKIHSLHNGCPWTYTAVSAGHCHISNCWIWAYSISTHLVWWQKCKCIILCTSTSYHIPLSSWNYSTCCHILENS